MTTFRQRDLALLDLMAAAASKIIMQIKPDTPSVERALVRLSEAQHWWHHAYKLCGSEKNKPDTVSALDTAGYHYRATWSEVDKVFVARVAEFESLGAHGDTGKAAVAKLQQVVADVVVDLMKSNEPIPKPVTDDAASQTLDASQPKEKE